MPLPPRTPPHLCAYIARIAHTAKGQHRADGVTRYIVHPQRVAELVETWTLAKNKPTLADYERTSAIGAAWLHDVVEDTGLTLADLRDFGVDARTAEIVDLLTKKNAAHEPETEEYYAAIAHDDAAVIVKCADRCANLEDVRSEVLRTGSVKRWKPYIERTHSDVLPIYWTLPGLRVELETRLRAIEEALLEVKGADPHGAFDCGEIHR